METQNKFSAWFCGSNDSTTSLLHPAQNWTDDECFIDSVGFCIHATFSALALIILTAIPCFNVTRSVNHRYLIPYPGHVVRWVIYMLYFVVCLCICGEGAMLDFLRSQSGEIAPPRFYVLPIAATVAAILVMVYYHLLEYWDLPILAILQPIYWISVLAAECCRLRNILNDPNIPSDGIRLILSEIVVGFAGIMALIELFLMWKLVCRNFSPIGEKLPADLRNPDMHYYDDYSSLPSNMLLMWMDPLYIQGYKNPIELKDLGDLPKRHRTRHISRRFLKFLKQEQDRVEGNGGDISLYRVLNRTLFPRMHIAGVLKFMADTSSFATPYLISGIIEWTARTTSSDQEIKDVKYISVGEFFSNGFVLVGLLFIQLAFQKLTTQMCFYLVINEAVHAQAAIQTAVFKKSLRLSTSAINGGSMTMGQITNHMSVDPKNLYTAIMWIHLVWSVPYLVSGLMFILYKQLGFSSLAGAALLFLSLPIQSLCASRQSAYQSMAMKYSDERLKKTNEVLQGIQVVKLNAWEKIFQTSIIKVKIAETVQRIRAVVFKIVLTGMNNAAPIVVMLVSYGLYTVISDKVLTPAITFASLSVFNQLATPLQLLSRVTTNYIAATVSLKRLTVFFQAPEIEVRDDGRQKGNEDDGLIDDDDDDDDDGDDGKHHEDKMNKLNTNGKKKETEGILNKPLQNLLKNAKRNQDNKYGAIRTDDDIYNLTGNNIELVAMRPWQTVPDDVMVQVSDGTFCWGTESTTPTLSCINISIPVGHLTMIVGNVGSGKSSLLSAILGEMKTLHGDFQWNRSKCSVAYAAQKSWLLNASLKENVLFGNPYDERRYRNVLQACCLQADIDILPEGDETEIGEKGINLSGGQKQRVSVARAMYSPTNVVILDDPLSALDVHVGGHMFYKGIMDFLIENGRTVILVTHQLQYMEHAELVIYMKDGLIARQGTMREIGRQDPELLASWNLAIKAITESEAESDGESSTEEERHILRRRVSMSKNEPKEAETMESKIHGREERIRGSTDIIYYWHYLQTFGQWAGFSILFLGIIQTAVSMGSHFWLSAWSDAGSNLTSNASKEEAYAILNGYLPVYAALSMSDVLFGLIWAAFLLVGCLRAGRKLHDSMLDRILHAPMRFFDITPIGRIMNRFSADVKILDEELSQNILRIVINVIISWYFVIAVVPIVLVYVFVMKIYLQTSRELNRLQSITRSPIFAFFSESLGGLPTIRAYSLNKQFMDTIIRKIEVGNVTFMYLQTSFRWLGIRLDMIGSVVVFAAGLSSILASVLHPSASGASLAGLAIVYAVKVGTSLNWVVRFMSSTEMGMNAVERLKYYAEIDIEKYEGPAKPRDTWPELGIINYERVHARYAKELDPVLRGVTSQFSAGDKIGICGRTGSGKSSLALTLFRIIDQFKGKIRIDGVDIGQLPLASLRSRLAIIPQDPVLFTGTIRFNLDPEEKRSDMELWEAINIAQMKPTVLSLEGGLDAEVSEGGGNFSVGQRQLFCLARAFLKKTRILVMDEATASIDYETDAILQEVVATAFRDRTVLTIAHRVATIMDSDQILVLDKGHVAETGPPGPLLAKEGGIFASLVANNQ
ncbi:ATP-binding cassette sub-family C member 9-like [Diadema antillarum]|uniref:ATP-binding cassette sub-family C member 9-like n=1 Tax=Diadema antillarum TaxID=105358 RepID=UPI003A8C2A6F